jgi:predicted porin
MKKTIIAAAVAASVAAPAAFADVTISGMVNPEFYDVNDSDFTGAADSGWTGSVNTDLVFQASDDLGNGMKASAKYHLFHDDGKANTNGHADMSVTLSGDFGAIVAGRMEPLIEGQFDAFANIDASHDLDLEAFDVMTRTTVGAGGLAYVSPSMNGLSVAVSNVASDDFSAANEVLVKYSNGGLSLMAIQSEMDGTTSATDTDQTGFAIGYKMGDLEVRAMTRSGETSGVDHDYDMIGAKYTMGANTFALGFSQEEGKGKLNSTVTATGDVDRMIVSASHALSKNTSVYVTYMDVDLDVTLSGAASGHTSTDGEADAVLFGIKQTF